MFDLRLVRLKIFFPILTPMHDRLHVFLSLAMKYVAWSVWPISPDGFPLTLKTSASNKCFRHYCKSSIKSVSCQETSTHPLYDVRSFSPKEKHGGHFIALMDGVG